MLAHAISYSPLLCWAASEEASMKIEGLRILLPVEVSLLIRWVVEQNRQFDAAVAVLWEVSRPRVRWI